MHGVRRSSSTSTAEEERYEQWSTETRQLLLERRDLQPDRFLERSETILLRNPEEYSLWNRRKELLVELYEQEVVLDANTPDCSDQSSLRNRCEIEFRVTEGALHQNPKSYAAWAHRLWLLRAILPLTPTLPSLTQTGTVRSRPPWHLPPDYAVECLRRELALLKQLISLDDRNFHGWRHFVEVLRLARHTNMCSILERAADESNVTDADAIYLLRFTRDVLNRNSCNYTAYHYRNVAAVAAASELNWHDELDAIHQAMYTEPNDQSVWFYYHRLMERWFGCPSPQAVTSAEAELRILDDLLALEPEARWALEAKAQLLIYHGRHHEAASIFREQLVTVDPMRRHMYEELADQCIRQS
jgi:geranylgeranyl transferase type-2 subunit alpha